MQIILGLRLAVTSGISLQAIAPSPGRFCRRYRSFVFPMFSLLSSLASTLSSLAAVSSRIKSRLRSARAVATD